MAHDQPHAPPAPGTENEMPNFMDPVVVYGHPVPLFMTPDGSFFFDFGGGGGSGAHTQPANGRNYIDEDIDGLKVWRNDDGTYGWEVEERGWFDLNQNDVYDMNDLDASVGDSRDNINIHEEFGSQSEFIDFLEDFFHPFDDVFI